MEKRYNSFVGYFREMYGERLQKVVLDAGFTCPNRDGKVGIGGCTYCDNAAFHPGYSTPGKPLLQQIDEGIEFHRVRYRNARRFLAYFQSFSNTYDSVENLFRLYSEALSHPDVAGIVVGTRPDCVDEEKLDMMADLAKEHIVILEYGIESCYDRTLERINRGHDFACARRACELTAERGLPMGAHFILGLPGETRQMMLDECAMINELPIRSVKFHQLQLVKNTPMVLDHELHPDDFQRFTLEEYLDFFCDMLERLRPDLYIERFAGEVPPRFVTDTPWGLVRNAELLHMLDRRLEERDTRQGRLYYVK